MTFSLSCLTKLPQTLILRELRLWCQRNIFLTVTSPPQWARSPLTFQAEHSEAVPWGASVPRASAGCSASTAVSQPTSQPALPRAGQSASAWDYRKPLPNPQLSGLSCWHLPIFHTQFHTLESARIILESEGSRGRAVDVRVVQCGQHESQPVCFSHLSAFSIAAGGAPHVIHNTKKKSLDSGSLFAINSHNYSLTSLFFC